jgi:transcriptional regulator with XRE-family HTH domain
VIPEPTTFADLLRRHRLARSLTQEQLAERAEITAKAVGALERGERRRPYRHTVRSLARALALGDGELAELENAVPFRVAPRGVTPPRSAATQDRDLPTPPDPVLGREDEVDLVSDLLRAGARRLITLVGTGGVGKTTLALVAAAAARSEFPGGVVMVELAGVSRGDDVVPKIRAALGVPEAAFDGTVASLATYLSGRRTLLVLDTVEHSMKAPTRGFTGRRRPANTKVIGPGETLGSTGELYDDEVGTRRSGRLDEYERTFDPYQYLYAVDVGDGSASAEEAGVHLVLDPDDAVSTGDDRTEARGAAPCLEDERFRLPPISST